MPPTALRFRVEDAVTSLSDRWQGPLQQNLTEVLGDFVLVRRDGIVSYQLAVVIDDALDGITDVVRGIDLLDNTPRQLALMSALGFASPRYLHHPVIQHGDGQKLSKQSHAKALDDQTAAGNLACVLDLIGIELPQPADRLHCDELLAHAIDQWRNHDLTRLRTDRYSAL